MRPLSLTDYLLMTIASHLAGKSPEDLYAGYEGQMAHRAAPQTDKETEEAVVEIYSAYPSRDRNNGNRSLGKCAKDKDRIRILLRTHTKEDILEAIQAEKDECDMTGKWMKNFTTFLNNLPDYGEEELPKPSIYQR